MAQRMLIVGVMFRWHDEDENGGMGCSLGETYAMVECCVVLPLP